MALHKDDWLNAIKILVETSNQILLDSLDWLAKHGEISESVSSSSRVNSNGGYLMHFTNEPAALANLDIIENTVQATDAKAKVIVYNCRNFCKTP